jgi:hypothetical protein
MGTVTQGPKVTDSLGAGIQTLAEKFNLPIEQVQGAYLRELARLESQARIKTFLPVLAHGTVRTELRRQQEG